ncbi:DNA helicase RecD, partial [Streptomyces sp. NPDC051130]
MFHEPSAEAESAGSPEDRQDEQGEQDERPGTVLVGLEGYALAEESLADGLARVASTFAGPADWEEAAASGGPGAELIRAVSGHGLVTHTGGE